MNENERLELVAAQLTVAMYAGRERNSQTNEKLVVSAYREILRELKAEKPPQQSGKPTGF